MTEVAGVRQSTGAVLLTALVVSLAVRCVAGQDMTATQMACCAGTEHDCGTAAAAAECCRGEAHDQEQLVAHHRQGLCPPAPIASAIADFTALADPHAARAVALERQPVSVASRPRYVLLSVLLV